jgi:septal ring factor EnvC (AmiA/AmiB activator)
MGGRLGLALLSSAAMLAVGCTLPGPVIVVTDPGLVTTTRGALIHDRADSTSPAVVASPTASLDAALDGASAEALAAHLQLDAVETQHKKVERRVAALKQGVTRVKGRHLVTGPIRAAVSNRVGTLESHIAALEAEFERRARRLDSILERLREGLPAAPDAHEATELPADDPTL